MTAIRAPCLLCARLLRSLVLLTNWCMQLAMEDMSKSLKDLEEKEEKEKEEEDEDKDKDDEKTQKSMTKQLGIFFMLYETKEAAGFTIFNEDGTVIRSGTRGLPVTLLSQPILCLGYRERALTGRLGPAA